MISAKTGSEIKMGGRGSGRRNQSGKGTTSDHRALDVRLMQRAGQLRPGLSFGLYWAHNGKTISSIQVRSEPDRVILNYQSRRSCGEWQPMEYPVYLEWTGCNFGGWRAWFLCPARGCGRRVAILYSGSTFACRHCLELAYECQRETDDDRAMRRADTIRRRLGWGAGIANPEGGKPNGMHWRTFEQLKAEYVAFANTSWVGAAKRIGLVNQRLGGLGHDA